MSNRASYHEGFAPRDGRPLYPSLWRGCVSAWNMGLGPTGSILFDWSGCRNDGTLTNMAPATDWAVRGGRYSLNFDASNDYIAVPDVSSLQFAANASMTIAGWVYVTSFTGYRTVLSKRVGTSTSVNYELSFNTGEGRFGFYAGTGFTVSTSAVSLNTWAHVACRVDSGGASYFINGIAAGTSATTVSASVAAILSIGAINLGGSSGQAFAGAMDDVRIYNRALDGNEVQLLASRRGIANELAPRRRASAASGNRRRRLLIG